MFRAHSGEIGIGGACHRATTALTDRRGKDSDDFRVVRDTQRVCVIHMPRLRSLREQIKNDLGSLGNVVGAHRNAKQAGLVAT